MKCWVLVDCVDDEALDGDRRGCVGAAPSFGLRARRDDPAGVLGLRRQEVAAARVERLPGGNPERAPDDGGPGRGGSEAVRPLDGREPAAYGVTRRGPGSGRGGSRVELEG